MEWILGVIALCAIVMVFLLDSIRVKLHSIEDGDDKILFVLEELAGVRSWAIQRDRHREEAERRAKRDREYQEVREETDKERRGNKR